METSKQRTERLMAMTHAQLMMHCQDLTAERDKLKKAAQAIIDSENVLGAEMVQADWEPLYWNLYLALKESA